MPYVTLLCAMPVLITFCHATMRYHAMLAAIIDEFFRLAFFTPIITYDIDAYAQALLFVYIMPDTP